MWSKGNTPPLIVGMQNCASSLDISMAVSQKIGNQLNSEPSNITLGCKPKDAQSYFKDICSITFITALFIIARIWKQPR